MEPEGSFMCSQEPATGPYSEPDESNPHRHTLFHKIAPRKMKSVFPYTLHYKMAYFSMPLFFQ